MIAEKLLQIERFLSKKGIKLQVNRQPPCSDDEITRAEASLGRALPKDLGDIYRTFAKGFDVFWEEMRAPNDFDFARFMLPTLGQFVQDYFEFHGETVQQHDHPEEYFDQIDDARCVLERMLNWAVLWDTGGDGNLVCIDLENETVLFHEREWSFYKQYVNGYLIAPSLDRLIEDWGNVCFLEFPGCPGHCPAHGASAVPDYQRQKFNIGHGSEGTGRQG